MEVLLVAFRFAVHLWDGEIQNGIVQALNLSGDVPRLVRAVLKVNAPHDHFQLRVWLLRDDELAPRHAVDAGSNPILQNLLVLSREESRRQSRTLPIPRKRFVVS